MLILYKRETGYQWIIYLHMANLSRLRGSFLWAGILLSTMQSTIPNLGNNLIDMVMSQGTPGKNKQANKTQSTNQATLIHPIAASQNKWVKLAVPALASLTQAASLHYTAQHRRSVQQWRQSLLTLTLNEHRSKDEQQTSWFQDKPSSSFSSQGQTSTYHFLKCCHQLPQTAWHSLTPAPPPPV